MFPFDHMAGSLLLPRDGLPPSASCRSPGALVHAIAGTCSYLQLLTPNRSQLEAPGDHLEIGPAHRRVQIGRGRAAAHAVALGVLKEPAATATSAPVPPCVMR